MINCNYIFTVFAGKFAHQGQPERWVRLVETGANIVITDRTNIGLSCVFIQSPINDVLLGTSD